MKKNILYSGEGDIKNDLILLTYTDMTDSHISKINDKKKQKHYTKQTEMRK